MNQGVIRIGQRDKWKYVAFPKCDVCGDPAITSTPQGIKTIHRCTEHRKIESATEARTIARLKQFGWI